MALREYDFENVPTVSIVKNILTDAIKMNATDIHFDPFSDELDIRFRINGDLKEYTVAPEHVKTNIITRIKILAGMNITDSLLPQIGTINFELNSRSHNMHVSSLPVVDGEKLVVHISNYAKNIKNLRNIGFEDNNIEKVKNLIKESQGILLITGNTNSGKTTTTYTLLKELNNKINNIISIEEPVKMRIKGINQVQIAPDKGLNYHNVLRNVMLQDPNIIAINELIDDYTNRMALRASVSGKLVISTMHTKNAYQTIDTLLNMEVENYLLGSNLIGIISQRLVKKLCPACRIKKSVTPYEKAVIKEILGEEIDELYYPNGCDECTEGYVEQIPVEEVIIITEELRRAIANNKKRELIRNIIYSDNESLIKNGFKKVLEGLTSFQEIIRIMDLKIDFSEENSNIKDIILGNGQQEEDKDFKTSHENTITFINNNLKNEEKKEDNNSYDSSNSNLKLSELELKNILAEIEKKASSNTTNDDENNITIEKIKEDQNNDANENTEKENIEQDSNESSDKMNINRNNNENQSTTINIEDDDDDDDFNYGESYINNF